MGLPIVTCLGRHACGESCSDTIGQNRAPSSTLRIIVTSVHACDCSHGTQALLCRAALTRAKQLVVVVGTWDALRLAVESERSDQRVSTLKHRITNLAVAAGAAPNQRMHSFGALPPPPPGQQQARGAPVSTSGPQTNARPQIPRAMQPAMPQRRSDRVATYARGNASYAPRMQQPSEHYNVAPADPARATESSLQ